MLNAVLVVMTLCYPAAVYFGIEYLEPKYFALVLLSLFGLRYLVTVKTATTNVALALFVVVTIFAGGAFVSNSEPLLLFYPVIVNVVLLAAFAWSLAFPPSVIERLARITDPNLPPGAVAYTRRVTVAWCFFFR